jgi:hypothetical protein
VDVAGFDPSGRAVVASAPDGRFAVSYQGKGSKPYQAVWVRRFEADGTAVDPAAVALTPIGIDAGHPHGLALDADGSLAVSWTAVGDVRWSLFSSKLEPVIEEKVAHVFTTGAQYAGVPLFRDGSLLVVWTSDAQDGQLAGVFGRRFDGKGNRLYP